MIVEKAYEILYLVVLGVLAVYMLFSMLRAIKGPHTADRLMGVNIIGTLATAMIGILALLLKQDWLLDVSLLYSLLSFLAVAVLANIYISVHLKRRNRRKKDNG